MEVLLEEQARLNAGDAGRYPVDDVAGGGDADGCDRDR
jgi:hypothetical protein